MRLQQLVVETLTKNRQDTSSAPRIVASLVNAGYSHEITSSQEKKIRSIVSNRAKVVASTPNPLKVTAGFNDHTKGCTCPYCNKPMTEVTLSGDQVKKANVCIDDRITLPI